MRVGILKGVCAKIDHRVPINTSVFELLYETLWAFVTLFLKIYDRESQPYFADKIKQPKRYVNTHVYLTLLNHLMTTLIRVSARTHARICATQLQEFDGTFPGANCMVCRPWKQSPRK